MNQSKKHHTMSRGEKEYHWIIDTLIFAVVAIFLYVFIAGSLEPEMTVEFADGTTMSFTKSQIPLEHMKERKVGEIIFMKRCHHKNVLPKKSTRWVIMRDSIPDPLPNVQTILDELDYCEELHKATVVSLKNVHD